MAEKEIYSGMRYGEGRGAEESIEKGGLRHSYSGPLFPSLHTICSKVSQDGSKNNNTIS